MQHTVCQPLGPHARKSANKYSINTFTPFTYSLYKSHRRSRLLCNMHTIRQRLSSQLGLSSGWNKEDDNTNDKDQKQPEASPNLFIMPTQTVKPSKPYITNILTVLVVIHPSHKSQRKSEGMTL